MHGWGRRIFEEETYCMGWRIKEQLDGYGIWCFSKTEFDEGLYQNGRFNPERGKKDNDEKYDLNQKSALPFERNDFIKFY